MIYDNSLFQAVYDQLESDDKTDFITTCRDVTRGGANGGFHGFCYFIDTRDFARKNMPLIVQALTQDAQEQDTTISEMVASFKCIDVDDITGCAPADFERIFWRVVYDQHNDNDDQDHTSGMILNALSWWTLEHVAFRVECEAEYEEQQARRAS